jgi:DNA polymerase delta subunit 1
VRKIELVKKRSIMGYMGDDWIPFMKITVSDSKNVPKARDKFLYVNL